MHENQSRVNKGHQDNSAAGNMAVPLNFHEPEAELNEHLPIQLKLAVGAANDPLEYEADAMADKVMRMPETSFIQRRAAAHDPSDYDDEHIRLKPLSNSITPFIQRCSCGGCDDERVHLKPLTSGVIPFVQAKSDGPVNVTDAVSGKIKSSMGGGNPMQHDTRSFMETRFGTDFSNVKIHNNDDSAQLNRSLNAKAFTVSNNIYFNSGHYQPGTDSGKHLLAHELTHVVQQGATGKNIQRQVAPSPVPAEFNVTGASKNSNSHKIFFDKDNAALDSTGSFKIMNLAGPPTPISGQIELKGFKSEEEASSLAQDRITAVKKEFQLYTGFTGTFTETPAPASGLGRIDYKSVRSVEIIEPGQLSTTPNCQTTAANSPCATATEGNFQNAVVEARKKIATAKGLLKASPRSSTTNDLLDKYFGQSVPGNGAKVLSTLLTNMDLISDQILRIKKASHHQCGNLCDEACASGAIAYNFRVGNSAVYTVCPAFDTLDEDNRFRNMIHECAHGTAGISSALVGTDDFAYRHERLIDLLDPAVALKNSDSYSLLIMFLADPGFKTQKPAVDDTSGVTKPAEKTQVGLPIANLEKWLTFAQQETSSLYGVIKKRLSATDWNNSYYFETMNIWSSNIKDLTATPALPGNRDQIIVAGIHDRVEAMARRAKQGLIFGRQAASPTSFETSSDESGKNVMLGDDFFALADATDRTTVLLKAIVHSNLKIPLASEAGYVDSIDKIRKRH
jgi:hypothetical protein